MTPQTPQERVDVGLRGAGLMGSAVAHRLLDQDITFIATFRIAGPGLPRPRRFAGIGCAGGDVYRLTP